MYTNISCLEMEIPSRKRITFLNYKKTEPHYKERVQKSFGPETYLKKGKNKQYSSFQHSMNEKHINSAKDPHKFDELQNIDSANISNASPKEGKN